MFPGVWEVPGGLGDLGWDPGWDLGIKPIPRDPLEIGAGIWAAGLPSLSLPATKSLAFLLDPAQFLYQTELVLVTGDQYGIQG